MSRRRSLTPTFRFVGGKGGVGKTTCAAALGLLAARAGQPTLIVSTDPAPSLGDALQQPLGRLPRKVRGVARLEAVEVDATAALAAWLEDRRGLLEKIALRGSWLDADDVARLLRLSLPGIDEIAGLLQLADFAASGRYEHIVVDTAPTGHLLRMIGMPAVLEGLAEVFDRMQGKHRTMVGALRGGWTPDAADALIQGIDEQARWLGALLRDPDRCRVSWVTLPEDMAIRETDDGLRALAKEQIAVDRVIVNRMTPPPRRPCDWCDGRRRLERTALQALRRRLRGSDVTIASVPALVAEPRGARALAAVTRRLSVEPAVPPPPPAGRRRRLVAPLAAPTRVVERSALMPAGTALVLFGGKGGVGKTTCAAALAIDTALTSTDRRVLLLSADPAHSLGDVLREDVADDPRPIQGGPANLSVRELDPSGGFAALRDRFARGIEELMLRVGGSAGDRQVFHDLLELAPPGVDELVAIVEVIETLDADAGQATFDLIVVDTAPTGHALRLLEMPALVHDWVKAVMSILLKYQPVIGVGDLGAALLRLSRGLGQLRALLTDAARTRFLVVTRAAALPRAETVRLLARLDAAGIAAPIVVVNAVGAGTCPRCRSEDAREYKEISALARGLPAVRGTRRSLLLAPATLPPPSGWRDLRRFFEQWRRLATEGRRWSRYHPAGTMAAATYVYCVIRSARKPAPARLPPGLPGAEGPQLAEVDAGMWVVLATVPLDRYGPGPLEESLRDLQWVSSTAVAHEAVVEHFAQLRGVTVIPMKLFSMFSSPARAIAEMRRRRRRLAALFDKFHGCEEWGVRILRGTPRLPGKAAEKPASGAAFLAARKRARDESGDALRASAEAADGAFARLAEIAADHRRREGEVSGVVPPLLDAAFLVPVRRRARFRAAAADAARHVTQQGARLTVTGPWPAYNFVSGSEEPA